jgi:hypothetical protein
LIFRGWLVTAGCSGSVAWTWEKVGGEVAFTKIGQHDDDAFSGAGSSGGHLEGRPGGGAAADSAKQSFGASELAGGFCCVFVGDGNHFINDAEVQVGRDKSWADTLDGVASGADGLSGASLGDDWAGGGFDGDSMQFWISLFEHFTDACDSTSGADSGDEDVDVSGGVAPDFFGGGAAVDFGVCGVLKLAWHEAAAAGIGQHLFSAPDGAGHTFDCGCEYDFGAEGEHKSAAFDGGGFGHGDLEGVAASGADTGKSNAGVATGSFEDCHAFLQRSGLLGRLNHGEGDSVFDTPERIQVFHFGDDCGRQISRQFSEANEWCVPDTVRDGFANAATAVCSRCHV